MKKKIVIIIVVILASLGAFFFLKEDNRGPSFSLVHLEKDDFYSTISTTGTVSPQNRLEVKSPVAGRVEELLVDEGDTVKKGEIIGWVSSAERVALIDAALAKGKEELERWKNIYKATPLVAAIDGTLISRGIEPGQTVATTDVIVTIADKLIVLAQVDETDVAQVKTGQKAEITLDAYPETEINGVVKHVAFEALSEESVTVYEVKVIPTNAPDFMKSGMSVNVVFITSEDEGVEYLPISAIQYDEERTYVLTGKNREKTYVETGKQFGQNIQILSGVTEKDNIWAQDFSFEAGEETSGSNPFLPTRRKRKK